MGCAQSSPDKQQTKKVEKEIQQDKTSDSTIKKLLFLGSGGSGKSTLFKQLRTIHGSGFLDKDRIGFKDHIYSQIIEQMKHMINCCRELAEEFPDDFGHLKLTEESEKAATYIDYVRGDIDVNEEVAQNIKILWEDPALKETFEQRAKLKIDDSSSYFFDNVDRIASRSYIPTDKDILLVRHRTTGVIEQKFEVKGTIFHIFDVGGQKSERKKWIHCFEHVTAVIFVASLSAYDEIMFEDDETNSMHDSIELFNEICNLRWFLGTAIILFLNKKDVFATKIQKIPLTTCFPEYDGSDNYDECAKYIRLKYEAKNKDPVAKQIYHHFTSATDKSQVESVFKDVQHIVIDQSLQKNGLI